jgi:hypothetical protein
MKADKYNLTKRYIIYLAEVYWRFGGLYCFNLQSQNSVQFYQTSWTHTSDITLNSHRREYLKSNKTEDYLTILYQLQRLLNMIDLRMTGGEIFRAVSFRSPRNNEDIHENRQSAL